MSYPDLLLEIQIERDRLQAMLELAPFTERLKEARLNGTDEEYEEAYRAYEVQLEKYYFMFRTFELDTR